MNTKPDRMKNFYIAHPMGGEMDFIPLVTEDADEDIKNYQIPDTIPILPLRNTVLFPGVLIPITVGRDKSIKLIREAYAKDRIIGTVAQKDANIEDPEYSDLFTIGTVAQIIKILEMPDNSTTVIIQGKKCFCLDEMISKEPYILARIHAVEEFAPKDKDTEFEAVIESLKDLSLKSIALSSNVPPEASFAIKNIESPRFLINFVSSNLDVKVEEKQRILEQNDLKKRSTILLEYLTREVQMLELKNDIQTKVKVELEQQQREFLLHQQIKTIQNELGGNPMDQEIEELKKKTKRKKWGKEMAKFFSKELEKLSRLNQASPEYSVQYNYLQTLLELPWREYSKDNFDLKRAKEILDRDHYGLDNVKDRILEHLAILKLKNDMKAPILCLYGPPGVGKTSLGKSIAEALGRKYIRMSLGGLHDEAEIRGHRKTYIGAMPGRIIQSIKKAKTSNPVIVLDEIDKVGNDYRGDPSSALLEVLDPEQNSAFYDNYLETEFDLSKAMFIATANTTSSIHPALIDRMELINVTGYIVEEKVNIASKYLIPKQLKLHGLQDNDLNFSEEVITDIIENYTRESGVRELDKKIANVVRHAAKLIASEEPYNKDLTKDDIRSIMGPPKYFIDKYAGNEIAGVVTGLAWTAVGGEILFVETSLSKGKGSLTMTGNLGDVMKESAILALEYLKAHENIIGIDSRLFDHYNVHVHVPEGAIPKDGPSAGITMVTSIASAFTQRKVKNFLAMTGEITLRGKVLPVGGIKEKILAAKRAGIKEIILSSANQNDISEIKEKYLTGLTFHYVDKIHQVLELALLDEKVEDPLQFVIEEDKGK
jgi:ATP-dependent Lon protease